jgi:alanine dehydrogenase
MGNRNNINKLEAGYDIPAAIGRDESEIQTPCLEIDLGAKADVIITIVSASEPLLMKERIKPARHIACMGTDTAAKQEIDAALVASGSVFADELAQSISMGEAQHAFTAGMISKQDITPIGRVINETHPGRSSEDELTLFDGSGVGSQDLAVASVAAQLAEQQGKAVRISL